MTAKPLYLNGQFVTTDKTFPVRNPATGEVIAQMPVCGRGRVAQALTDAHAAFQSWRNLVVRTRGDFPLKIAAEVERRKDEFAKTITPCGLAAYVFTRDLSRAFRLMESLEAGMIGINDGVPTTSNGPFGGVKQSGWGRELGTEGMDAFLETKHVSLVV
jgi:acyl-CoA reductase-like NAD-dependent aldehyde dehydrogenase